MNASFCDFHIHPTIKPFGHACKTLLKHHKQITPDTLKPEFLRQNTPRLYKAINNSRKKASIWHNKQPNSILNPLFGELGFAKFNQGDLTTAQTGFCHVVAMSLYPIEKEFLSKTIDQKISSLPILKNIITGISLKRIKYVQSKYYQYFNDVQCEYQYLVTSSELSEGKFILASCYNDIKMCLNNSTAPIIGIVTIEGANVFYPGTDISQAHIQQVTENIRTAKNWQYPPFIITLAHHFYNGFVSHERSLTNLVTKLGNIDQTPYMNQPVSNIPGFNYFTSEGLKVIDELLDNTNGRRILIDVKHIDYNGRREYYDYIERQHKNQIPVIFTHAAVGAKTPEEWFNNRTLNLNNNDIEAVWKTQGLIGIELDQRVLGWSEFLDYKKKGRGKIKRNDPLYTAEIIWNAAFYIATTNAILIDNETEHNNTNAWSTIVIGSDFDGLINPVNGYPNLASYPLLKHNLKIYAQKFLNGPQTRLHNYSPYDAEVLVNQILRQNGLNFLRAHFRAD